MPNLSQRVKGALVLFIVAIFLFPCLTVPWGQAPDERDLIPAGEGYSQPTSSTLSDLDPYLGPRDIDLSQRNLAGPVLLETDSYYRLPNGTLVPVPDEDEEMDGGRGSDEKQPFTHHDTRMVPREELVIVTSDEVAFFDDHDNSYGYMRVRDKFRDELEDLRPATGDFDGDGRDETAILALHDSDISLWVLDDYDAGLFDYMTFEENILGTEDDDNMYGPHRHGPHSIATGDIDGDGKDEIGVVVAVVEWIEFDEPLETFFGIEITGTFGTFVRVILFDDAQEDFAELTNWNVGRGYLPDITMGDMTGDAREEIIFSATEGNMWDVNLFIFQYNESNLVKMSPLIRDKETQEYWSGGEDTGFWWGKEVNVGDPEDGNQRQDSEVITGDIDGDGLQEVLVLTGAHERLDEEEDMATVLDAYDYLPAEKNMSHFKKVPDQWYNFHDDSGWLRLDIKTGDVDGDMMDEIIVAGPWDDDVDAWIFDDAQHSFEQMKRWDDNDGLRPGRRSSVEFDVGDVDCDGKDEVVFITEEKGSKSIWNYIFGGDSS